MPVNAVVHAAAAPLLESRIGFCHVAAGHAAMARMALQLGSYLDDKPISKASLLMEADLRVKGRTGVRRKVWLPSSHSPQVLPQPP